MTQIQKHYATRCLHTVKVQTYTSHCQSAAPCPSQTWAFFSMPRLKRMELRLMSRKEWVGSVVLCISCSFRWMVKSSNSLLFFLRVTKDAFLLKSESLDDGGQAAIWRGVDEWTPPSVTQDDACEQETHKSILQGIKWYSFLFNPKLCSKLSPVPSYQLLEWVFNRSIVLCHTDNHQKISIWATGAVHSSPQTHIWTWEYPVRDPPHLGELLQEDADLLDNRDLQTGTTQEQGHWTEEVLRAAGLQKAIQVSYRQEVPVIKEGLRMCTLQCTPLWVQQEGSEGTCSAASATCQEATPALSFINQPIKACLKVFCMSSITFVLCLNISSIN